VSETSKMLPSGSDITIRRSGVLRRKRSLDELRLRRSAGDSITYAGGTPHRYPVYDRRTARLLVTIINEDCDAESGRPLREEQQ